MSHLFRCSLLLLVTTANASLEHGIRTQAQENAERDLRSQASLRTLTERMQNLVVQNPFLQGQTQASAPHRAPRNLLQQQQALLQDYIQNNATQAPTASQNPRSSRGQAVQASRNASRQNNVTPTQTQTTLGNSRLARVQTSPSPQAASLQTASIETQRPINRPLQRIDTVLSQSTLENSEDGAAVEVLLSLVDSLIVQNQKDSTAETDARIRESSQKIAQKVMELFPDFVLSDPEDIAAFLQNLQTFLLSKRSASGLAFSSSWSNFQNSERPTARGNAKTRYRKKIKQEYSENFQSFSDLSPSFSVSRPYGLQNQRTKENPARTLALVADALAPSMSAPTPSVQRGSFLTATQPTPAPLVSNTIAESEKGVSFSVADRRFTPALVSSSARVLQARHVEKEDRRTLFEEKRARPSKYIANNLREKQVVSERRVSPVEKSAAAPTIRRGDASGPGILRKRSATASKNNALKQSQKGRAPQDATTASEGLDQEDFVNQELQREGDSSPDQEGLIKKKKKINENSAHQGVEIEGRNMNFSLRENDFLRSKSLGVYAVQVSTSPYSLGKGTEGIQIAKSERDISRNFAPFAQKKEENNTQGMPVLLKGNNEKSQQAENIFLSIKEIEQLQSQKIERKIDETKASHKEKLFFEQDRSKNPVLERFVSLTNVSKEKLAFSWEEGVLLAGRIMESKNESQNNDSVFVQSLTPYKTKEKEGVQKGNSAPAKMGRSPQLETEKLSLSRTKTLLGHNEVLLPFLAKLSLALQRPHSQEKMSSLQAVSFQAGENTPAQNSATKISAGEIVLERSVASFSQDRVLRSLSLKGPKNSYIQEKQKVIPLNVPKSFSFMPSVQTAQINVIKNNLPFVSSQAFLDSSCPPLTFNPEIQNFARVSFARDLSRDARVAFAFTKFRVEKVNKTAPLKNEPNQLLARQKPTEKTDFGLQELKISSNFSTQHLEHNATLQAIALHHQEHNASLESIAFAPQKALQVIVSEGEQFFAFLAKIEQINSVEARPSVQHIKTNLNLEETQEKTPQTVPVSFTEG
ncbi:hypothetical protein AGMMS49949_01370 [Alphaproteobacteria bacterium]|nr:hypothetical protein AGMMS49949_01370 [Alphaproteobacteria bacterium]GHS95681.1 hypothetical protein AGMMS50296_0560 [Alphaproteobacteria bacterium]